MTAKKGKLYVVGIGPGHHDHMTYRAKQVIEESEIVVGYDTYISLVEDLIDGKEVYRYPMTQEVDRANQAIQFAEEGKIVSLVSSGDPGIYGMIGLIYEILSDKKWNRETGIYVECVPGVSSLNSCSALVGSPLMTDFAVVSMSDLLVPWEIIVKRVEAAAAGDYVTVIYNPASKKRVHQLKDTNTTIAHGVGYALLFHIVGCTIDLNPQYFSVAKNASCISLNAYLLLMVFLKLILLRLTSETASFIILGVALKLPYNEIWL